MYTIISTPTGKFKIKEIDGEGNSVRVIDIPYNSELEAQKAIDELTKNPSTEGANDAGDTKTGEGEATADQGQSAE